MHNDYIYYSVHARVCARARILRVHARTRVRAAPLSLAPAQPAPLSCRQRPGVISTSRGGTRADGDQQRLRGHFAGTVEISGDRNPGFETLEGFYPPW